MARALPAGIPSIEETGYTRESIVDALRNDTALPSGAVTVATLYADVIEPDVLAALERAQQEDLDLPSDRLLFRGIHILGGRRFPATYRPLVAFLRGPQDRVEALLGDAITENLSQILAGLFDGDEQPLRELIVDRSINSFIREAAFNALAFMTFEGQTDRAAFEAFLLRFDEEKLATADDDVMWHAWMTVVAVLGVTALEGRARAAFTDGRIAPHWCDEDDFDELLKAAIERPEDRSRLEREQMGYLDDVLAALEKFPEREEDSFSGTDAPDGLFDLPVARNPVHNPFRNVGRNDPCPCGSGKKFKKCCLRDV
jgi:hypothetical protein